MEKIKADRAPYQAIFAERNYTSDHSKTREVDRLPTEVSVLKDIVREAEKKAIADALSERGWNITQTAKLLGISRASLQNKMKLYNLREPSL